MDEEEDIAMILMLHNSKKSKHGGSIYGREYLRRMRIDGHIKLMLNYFVETPVYPEKYFCCRFRMSTELFKYIADCVAAHERFFVQRRNCTGQLGHSTMQKVTAAIRMMAYGILADLVDDHLAMGRVLPSNV